MFTIYKKASFESAHLLDGHPKCGKLHGHSYTLEVWITAERTIQPHNFILDFHIVKDIVKEYDHSDVVIPISAEILAKQIANKIAGYMVQPYVSIKARVWETSSAYAEYLLDKEPEIQ